MQHHSPDVPVMVVGLKSDLRTEGHLVFCTFCLFSLFPPLPSSVFLLSSFLSKLQKLCSQVRSVNRRSPCALCSVSVLCLSVSESTGISSDHTRRTDPLHLSLCFFFCFVLFCFCHFFRQILRGAGGWKRISTHTSLC